MNHQAHAHHPANPVKTYTLVLLALLALTVITVTASKIQFGSGLVNAVVALGIATLKASLVGLYFMHLRYDKPVNAIAFVASFTFLFIFLIFSYTDAATREPIRPSNLRVTPPAPPPAAQPAPTVPPAPAAAQQH
jgi:cytochrome c oxidase subunit 4